MPEMKNILKTLRKQKSWTRQQLAEKSKLSERQIARLEGDSLAISSARSYTLEQLSNALNVSIEVLQGNEPLPAEGENKRKKVQISTQVDSETVLMCDLIASVYGVNRTDLIRAAPLMFVLLAEGSLKWRTQKVEKIEAAIAELQELGGTAGHLAFVQSVYRALNGTAEEKSSIEKRDLFGRMLEASPAGGDEPSEAINFGWDPDQSNPFADYLRHLSHEIDKPSMVELSADDITYSPRDFPEFDLFSHILDNLAGKSKFGGRLLKEGLIRLSDIPKPLMRKGCEAERAAWLDEQVPEDKRTSWADFDASIEDIVAQMSVDKSEGIK